MKTKRLMPVMVGILIGLMVISQAAADGYINDTGTNAFWGGSVVNASSTAYGDVIGTPYFDVNGMNVTRSGNTWNVTLSGAYFGYHNNPLVDGGMPAALGYGDLYINSNGWSASGSGNYATDTFTSAEGWNYVVTNGSNGWGLYTLDFNNTTNATDLAFTNVSPLTGNYIYRQGQAWRGGAGTLVGSASFSENFSDSITFSFDASNVAFGDTAGFHWTMQCGNDVVEGAVAVPEPSELLLLGCALLALFGYQIIRGRAAQGK